MRIHTRTLNTRWHFAALTHRVWKKMNKYIIFYIQLWLIFLFEIGTQVDDDDEGEVEIINMIINNDTLITPAFRGS